MTNPPDIFRPQRLYSYVVASDRGLAPNITGGICSLAVCKPMVRQQVVPGRDWILGLSTAEHGRTRLIYAMQVDEKLSYGDYFVDPRFAHKKPPQDPVGDNFFRATKAGHQLSCAAAAHYGRPLALTRDLKAPYAIIGHRFWYFGANAPELPAKLVGSNVVLPDAYRRGHRVNDDTPVIQAFVRWIEQYPPGVYGPPRDVVPVRPAANPKTLTPRIQPSLKPG